MYDSASRGQKARKAIAILADQKPTLTELDLLEIGCSAGYGTAVYAEAFRSVTGIDIDEPAVAHAQASNARPNVRYLVMDSERTGFPDACFDAIVCTHIYEHVPDARRLMQEIHRLLRPAATASSPPATACAGTNPTTDCRCSQCCQSSWRTGICSCSAVA